VQSQVARPLRDFESAAHTLRLHSCSIENDSRTCLCARAHTLTHDTALPDRRIKGGGAEWWAGE
jgi:hypothetical protein